MPLPRIETKADPSPLTPIAVWLVRATMPLMPAGVTPNQVTVFGWVCQTLAGLCLYLAGGSSAWFVPAAALSLVHWLADNLDGELARERGLRSERGFFLDLFLDQAGIAALVFGTGAASYSTFALWAVYEALILLRSSLLLHRILFRQEFVIPFPGISEVPFLVVALALLQGVLGTLPIDVGGRAPSWADAIGAALVLAIFVDVVGTTIAFARELPGPAADRAG
jgi:phosphatidylglycerophosphate synthase